MKANSKSRGRITGIIRAHAPVERHRQNEMQWLKFVPEILLDLA